VAPQAGTVAAGGVALYAHRFTAGSALAVGFAAAQAPTPAIPGWSATLYRDLDCDGVLDAGEPVLPPASTVAVPAGGSVCVIARHSAPAGAPAGALETVTLTASFTYTGALPVLAGSDAHADVTTIALANGLVLTKSVNLATARPGDLLVYTISYTNPGGQPLSNIVISDTTPTWTVFDSATCASPGFGITGCALTQPASGASGPVSWVLAGALAPGGSGVVSYRVRVQ